MKVLLGQLARFLGVGAAMTLLGYGVIIALTEIAGMAPLAANFIAYAVLIALSYWLHARITFGTRSGAHGLLRFFGSFAVAYLANVLVLLALVDHVHHALAQLAAITTYAVVHFFVSRRFVFNA